MAALEAETSQNAAGKPAAVAALRIEMVRLVRDLIERYPDSPDAMDAAATLYRKLGRADAAAGCWRQCLNLSPDFGDAHYQLGLFARNRGDNAAAVEHFRKAIAWKASVPGIADPLGWALIDLGRPAEAIEVLREHLAARPTSATTRTLLGQAYLRLKDYRKAAESFEAAIALAPELGFPYPGAAAACAKLGEKEKAARYAERYATLRAAKEQGDRERTRDEVRDAGDLLAFLCVVAGKVYCAQGDLQTAEATWRRAAELTPDSLEPPLLLAWSFERQGRLEDAVRALAGPCDAHPDDLESHLQLVQLQTRLGRWEQAEATLRRVVERAPKRAEPYSALANLLLQRGKDAEARRLAVKAAELDPIALNHSLVAVACWRCGDRNAAMAAIERALAGEPENARYRALAEAIRAGAPPGAPAPAPR